VQAQVAGNMVSKTSTEGTAAPLMQNGVRSSFHFPSFTPLLNVSLSCASISVCPDNTICFRPDKPVESTVKLAV
jgi:hypothetical protein